DGRRIDGTGEDLISACQFDQLDAVRLEVVVLADLLECHPDVGQPGIGIERRELLDGEWTDGAEERRFKQLGEWRHGQSPWAQRRRTGRSGASPAWRARGAPTRLTGLRRSWDRGQGHQPS